MFFEKRINFVKCCFKVICIVKKNTHTLIKTLRYFCVLEDFFCKRTKRVTPFRLSK
ncbi:hypothetical protein CoNPh26_CDS0088 [Staphylococcus phage S-CoN_Ph26]|nr:hypothetical protein CoNPh26_CDS0088 [Staphylococcus phage S-CoN_Ph26]